MSPHCSIICWTGVSWLILWLKCIKLKRPANSFWQLPEEGEKLQLALQGSGHLGPLRLFSPSQLGAKGLWGGPAKGRWHPVYLHPHRHNHQHLWSDSFCPQTWRPPRWEWHFGKGHLLVGALQKLGVTSIFLALLLSLPRMYYNCFLISVLTAFLAKPPSWQKPQFWLTLFKGPPRTDTYSSEHCWRNPFNPADSWPQTSDGNSTLPSHAITLPPRVPFPTLRQQLLSAPIPNSPLPSSLSAHDLALHFTET